HEKALHLQGQPESAKSQGHAVKVQRQAGKKEASKGGKAEGTYQWEPSSGPTQSTAAPAPVMTYPGAVLAEPPMPPMVDVHATHISGVLSMAPIWHLYIVF